VELQRDEGLALVVVTHAPAVARRFGAQWTLHNGKLVSA